MKFIGKERAWEFLARVIVEEKSPAKLLRHKRETHTQEAKQKISEAVRRTWEEGAYDNRTYTDEQRERRRQAMSEGMKRYWRKRKRTQID